MRKLFYVLIPIIIYTVGLIKYAFSQAPPIQWEKCYGSNSNDFAYSVNTTIDGGYIVAGAANSNSGDVTGINGDYDFWIFKTDVVGNMEWQKCLGGSGIDEAHSIQQTFDGGYIVAGWTFSHDSDVTGLHGNGSDFWIVKLDSAGTIQWEKCHGGSLNEYAYSIQQTRDSGYYVVGQAASTDGEVTGGHGDNDCWITKLDATGNLEWERAMGGIGSDFAYSVMQTLDGGCIVAGRAGSIDGDVTDSNGGSDCWIIKFDSSGGLLWKQCYGGHTNDETWSIVQTKDSGYVFAGQPTSNDSDVTGNHGNLDYWLVKIDSIGILQWQKCFGGFQSDGAFSIIISSDGGYVMAGFSNSNDFDVTGQHGNGDYWIVKTDSAGTMEWEQCYGGSSADKATSIIETNDGGFMVAGSSHSYDGEVTGNHGVFANDIWLVKLAPPLGAIIMDESKSNFNVYPNPVTDKMEIQNTEVKIKKVEIINLVGEEIMSLDCKQNTVSVSTVNMLPGMYFAAIHTEKGVVTKKFIKE